MVTSEIKSDKRTVFWSWRIAKGMTQGQVAGRVGVDERTLRRWEYGVDSPSPDNLLALLGALEMPPPVDDRLTVMWDLLMSRVLVFCAAKKWSDAERERISGLLGLYDEMVKRSGGVAAVAAAVEASGYPALPPPSASGDPDLDAAIKVLEG